MRETVVKVRVIHTSFRLIMNHTPVMVVVGGLPVHQGVLKGRSFLLSNVRQHPAECLPKNGEDN